MKQYGTEKLTPIANQRTAAIPTFLPDPLRLTPALRLPSALP